VTLQVGIDVVAVEFVRDSLRAHGDRYLERIFTEQEVKDCRLEEGISIERLAARFAAKEATMKALRLPRDEGLDLRSIELVREPGGWTSLRLSGGAAALAERQGISELAVSITHDGPVAAAVVVASRAGRTPLSAP
jgi:holo-[acyl-carrier protein] synthase